MGSSYLLRFKQHKMNAKNYGTPWEITYSQWRRIWYESGKWYKRGPKRGQYVMARFGDKGPYSFKNVKIISSSANCREAWLERNHSTKTRAKMSISQMGNTNPLGCVRSAESRAKMSKAKRGRKLSYEHRANISIATMGGKNGRAKLTEKDVKIIRKLGKQRLSQKAIADEFKISKVTVSKIVRKVSWAHVN